MREGFHGSPEGLLADEGKSIGVIYHDESETVGLRVPSLAIVIDLVSDGMNSSVLF